MPVLPGYLALAFGATTVLAAYLFYRAAHRAGWVLAGLAGWALLHSLLAARGFYLPADSRPPRLLLALAPPLLGLAGLLAAPAGRRWLRGLHPGWLTLLHAVRLPVELVLLGLCLHGAVPRLLTFEGCNWDVAVGLSAPLVWYLAFRVRRLGPGALLAWHCAGLALLLNVVTLAVLAVPSVVQRLAFDQPNVAVLHFPFVLLPAVVVPLVLLAHVAAIGQLWPRQLPSGQPEASTAAPPPAP